MNIEHTLENPVIVGLDIGTTKIAAIVAQRDKNGKLNIIATGKVASHGVERGEVSNIKLTTEAIQQAVAEAERKSGFKITSVFVGIAGQHISSKQSRDIYTLSSFEHEITRDDLRMMAQNMYRMALEPGEKIITVLPQEFRVDNQEDIINPIGMCGSRIEANFHIITGKVSAAQNIKRCVERAGLKMAGLFLEPLASSASVLEADELEAGVALVDIGGGTTDIAIFKNKIIRHTAVIPFAGNIITRDIMEGLRLLKPYAEKLKTNFGCAVPDETHEHEIISIPGIGDRPRREISRKVLSKIINARMEEIMAQVYFEIKSSGLASKLNAGLVITGGGSQLKHIKQLAEYCIGLNTRVGYPTAYLAKGNKEELKHPLYATGVGLVMEGYREYEDMTTEQRMEFFPELFVKQETVAEQNTVEQLLDSSLSESISDQTELVTATETTTLNGKKTRGLLETITLKFRNWFEVDVESDGDFGK